MNKKSSKIKIVIFLLFALCVSVAIGLYFNPTDWVCKTFPKYTPKCKGDKCSDCEGYNCTGGVSFKRDADGKCTIPTECVNDSFFHHGDTCLKIRTADADNNIKLNMNEMMNFGSMQNEDGKTVFRRLMLTKDGLQSYNNETVKYSAITTEDDPVFNFDSGRGELKFGKCSKLPRETEKCDAGTTVYKLQSDNDAPWIRTRKYCNGTSSGHVSSDIDDITSEGTPKQC